MPASASRRSTRRECDLPALLEGTSAIAAARGLAATKPVRWAASWEAYTDGRAEQPVTGPPYPAEARADRCSAVTPPAGDAASLPRELHDARELPNWVASPKASEPPESIEVGDPVAASNGGQPLLSCSAGRSRDPARGRGRTDDLGPCRPGPTPAEPLRGGASVEIAQGKGNPEGNRRRTGTGQRPKGTNRRTPDQGNHGKAGEGEEPGGQTGSRRKARRGKPEDAR